MKGRCSGNGLMVAGLIVGGIGLALIIGETFHLPRHWQMVAVGAVLFAVGALRRATRRPDDSSQSGGR